MHWAGDVGRGGHRQERDHRRGPSWGSANPGRAGCGARIAASASGARQHRFDERRPACTTAATVVDPGCRHAPTRAPGWRGRLGRAPALATAYAAAGRQRDQPGDRADVDHARVSSGRAASGWRSRDRSTGDVRLSAIMRSNRRVVVVDQPAPDVAARVCEPARGGAPRSRTRATIRARIGGPLVTSPRHAGDAVAELGHGGIDIGLRARQPASPPLPSSISSATTARPMPRVSTGHERVAPAQLPHHRLCHGGTIAR